MTKTYPYPKGQKQTKLGAPFTLLMCGTCERWTWHQYPRAPKTYFPIRCLKCGDRSEIETRNTHISVRNGVRARHTIHSDYRGLLAV